MTEDNGLSRRKLLGSVATIGGAAALGGAGSVAFFSDREEFANNRLVAGELDLKVDWEEHYSDWSDDEAEGVGEVVMTDGDPANVPEGYVGLPDPTEPLIAVPGEDLETFMDNTAIEAYPDPDGDGVQEPFAAEPGGETEDGVGYICEDGADTDEDLDPTEGLRTAVPAADAARGEATIGEDGEPLPLIDIQDVKPGDFGELTLSYHLCGNPGFVWLQADDVLAEENDYTEPERKDSDESGDADDDGEDDVVELLDEIQTTWWYDTDGDNVLDAEDEGGGEAGIADVVIVMDVSGSMSGSKLANAKEGAKALVDAVGDGVDVALVPFSNSASVAAGLGTDPADVKTAIDNLSAGGGTNLGGGITAAQSELVDNGREDAANNIVALTNGISSSGSMEATTAKNAGTTIYGIAYGAGADEGLIEDISSPPKNQNGSIDEQDQFAFTGDTETIEQVFTDIGGGIVAGGETVFFRGTLREALDLLAVDEAAGDKGLLLDADPSTEEVDPFEASTTNYVGFAWYLPVDHANEIQTDGVQFDLGFYTEQARHNDVGGNGNTA